MISVEPQRNSRRAEGKGRQRKVASIGAVAFLLVPLLVLPFAALPSAAASVQGWSSAEITVDLFQRSPNTQPITKTDALGRSLSVWTYRTPNTNSGVWAARWLPGSGWQTVEPVDDQPSAAQALGMDLNEAGEGMLVWLQRTSGLYNDVWARSFSFDKGWGTAEILDEVVGGNATTPAVTMGGDGMAVAAWVEPLGVVKARHHAAGGNWGATETLYSNVSGAFGVWLASDGKGDAIAFAGVPTLRTLAFHYVPALGWSTPVEMSSSPTVWAFNPAISMRSTGEALAAWVEFDAPTYNLTLRWYDPQLGWQPAQIVYFDPYNSVSPGVALAEDGSAFLAWIDTNSSLAQVYAARIASQGAAMVIQNLTTELVTSATLGSIDVDGKGRAAVAWGDFSGASSTWVARYDPAFGWWPGQNVTPPGAGALTAQFGLNTEGDGAFVFAVSVGPNWSLWSTRLDVPDWIAPALQVSAPLEGFTTNASTVEVRGITEVGSTVFVNGVVAAVAPDGSFRAVASLVPGANTVEVRGWDPASNEASPVSIHGTYVDLAADLQAQLAEAQVELGAATANVTAAQAAIAQLQQDAAVSAGDLADAVAALSQAEADVAALGATVNSTLVQLQASDAARAGAEQNLTGASAALAVALAQSQAANANLTLSIQALDAARANVTAESVRANEAAQSAAVAQAQLVATQSELALAREQLNASQHNAAASGSGPDILSVGLAIGAMGLGAGALVVAMGQQRRLSKGETRSGSNAPPPQKP